MSCELLWTSDGRYDRYRSSRDKMIIRRTHANLHSYQFNAHGYACWKGKKSCIRESARCRARRVAAACIMRAEREVKKLYRYIRKTQLELREVAPWNCGKILRPVIAHQRTHPRTRAASRYFGRLGQSGESAPPYLSMIETQSLEN